VIYGLYLSAQGAELQSTRLDVVANNLANAGTNSFKRDLAVFQAHLPHDLEHGENRPAPGNLNESTGGLALGDIITDYSNGSLIESASNYDLALAGPGFFQVSHGDQSLLTRDGRMTINDDGQLVTEEGGLPFKTTSGSPVVIPRDTLELTVNNAGEVFADDTLIGQLDIVVPESDSQLQKVGGNYYQASGRLNPISNQTRVRQGFVEASGTNPIREMMELIDASHGLETNLNMIKYQDEALARLLQSAAQ